jgi:hypothetical protein
MPFETECREHLVACGMIRLRPQGLRIKRPEIADAVSDAPEVMQKGE